MLSSIMRKGCFIPTPSQLEELGINERGIFCNILNDSVFMFNILKIILHLVKLCAGIFKLL